MSGIVIKSAQEIEGIRKAGLILGRTLGKVGRSISPGQSTGEINSLVEDYIRSQGAVPVFKGYRGFPAASCISVNEQVIHGIPGERVLRQGDLVKVDVGVAKDGFIADAAVSVGVGDIDRGVEKLMRATNKALWAGIKMARAGNRIGDLSNAIQSTAEEEGFGVVKDYFGHGTGLALHEEPNIPNFGPADVGPRLQKGMTIAIEPMLTMGSAKVRLLDDEWTVVTADGGFAAHFEHTVVITANGSEVLTEDV